MRFSIPATICAMSLLLGCSNNTLSQFWKGVPLLEEDIRVSEERFADFAELAVASPEKEATAALDALFDRLREDEVAYYVYAAWIDGAFYSVLSPCRSAVLYSYAVNRIVKDGVLNQDECRPYLKRRDWICYNVEGAPATIPGVILNGKRTLVLVMDLSCPSCRKALDVLSQDSAWNGVRKIALGIGYGSIPEAEGWELYTPENAAEFYDVHISPVYYVVSPDGIVELSYTAVI